MSCLYIVKEEVVLCEGAPCVTYGIEAVCDGAVVARLPSLFVSRMRAERLAALANRLRLSPSHLSEVAEDILAE